MDEQNDTSPRPDAREPQEGRELLLMHRRGRAFAVYADEAEAVTEGRRPAPLPHAPRAVLGVVPVRGRMHTLLDPAALLETDTGEDEDAPHDADAPAFVVTLRGDEQLALACDRAERTADAPAPDITLLDPARLFEAAMRGTDRRRPRLKKA
ncbi:MAG TPA: chemotaxis protein CheW [Pyrinomonadaceae bacterium]|jgi:chemotaxis signal transduction protein|nr:chemotaxis protein CheW [Pyrinomonadaceae bacterium]